MNIKCVAEHCIDLSLITRESKVLDLGCRAFSWSKAMLEYVDNIYAVEADPEVKSDDARIDLYNKAISIHNNKLAAYRKFGNGTGNYILPQDLVPRGQAHRFVNVITMSLEALCEETGVSQWDACKMDIEGSEIGVLTNLNRPMFNQLSVEFHMHTGTTEAQILSVFEHLKQWYNIVFIDKSEKHGCGINYWDCLFILNKINDRNI